MSEEKKSSNRRSLPRWGWLLLGIAAVALLGAAIWGWTRPAKTVTIEKAVKETVEVVKEVTRIVEIQATPTTPTAAPTETPTTVPAQAAQIVDTSEPLIGTLDDFGRATRYDDRFPTNGMVWDQSYNEGELFVANMWATHDHEFKSQEGCVVVYYRAPKGGGRIRFTAWDGMGFELNADSGVSLNQAIAAMRTTLVDAHGCKGGIQYHELVRHGDPVK